MAVLFVCGAVMATLVGITALLVHGERVATALSDHFNPLVVAGGVDAVGPPAAADITCSG